MKRANLLLLVVLLITLSACGSSPKARAQKFASYMPARIDDWQREDRRTVELLSSTIASKGHVTFQYTGPDGALAYIVIDVHPSDDAAKVAAVSRERELRMMGLDVRSDISPPKVAARIAQGELTWYALFEDSRITVEINVVADNADSLVSEEDFDALVDYVRAVYDRMTK